MKIDRGYAGLAISGGVDSMALAAVCSRLQHERDSVDVFDVDDKQLDKLHSLLKYIRFRAFLVDHGIRKGSDEEAHAVSKILEERGTYQLSGPMHQQRLREYRYSNPSLDDQLE